jgi:predicted RNA methylase
MSSWLQEISKDLTEDNKINFSKSRDLFPKGLPYHLYLQLMVNKEIVFSITPQTHNDQIMRYITELLKKPLKDCTVMDATACGGGFTINLLNKVKRIDAFEINPINFQALQHNVNIYKFANRSTSEVNLYCMNFLEHDNKNYDIMLIDPPWGGFDYKNTPNLDLSLSKVDLIDVVLSYITTVTLIICKVPNNYNFDGMTAKVTNVYPSASIKIMSVGRDKYKVACISLRSTGSGS